MPFDSQGIHTLPLGYLAVTGQTVLASNHNPPLEDISSSLSQVLLRSGVAPMIGNLKMNTFRITGLGDGTASTDAATKGQLDGAIPVGSGMDFWGATAPTGFIFAYGQAISRTTYAALFAVLGTVYGVGDGSTTFNVPDKRGRASFGKDNMGGASADRLTNQTGGINGDTLGATGGTETHTLTTAQLASHTHAAGTLATSNAGSHSHDIAVGAGGANDFGANIEGATATVDGRNQTANTSSDGTHTHNITGSTASAGSNAAHNNVPPGIVCNYIIRTGV